MAVHEDELIRSVINILAETGNYFGYVFNLRSGRGNYYKVAMVQIEPINNLCDFIEYTSCVSSAYDLLMGRILSNISESFIGFNRAYTDYIRENMPFIDVYITYNLNNNSINDIKFKVNSAIFSHISDITKCILACDRIPVIHIDDPTTVTVAPDEEFDFVFECGYGVVVTSDIDPLGSDNEREQFEKLIRTDPYVHILFRELREGYLYPGYPCRFRVLSAQPESPLNSLESESVIINAEDYKIEIRECSEY